MSASNTIRVAVVEDNPQFRESLAALLRLSPGFTLVAACADAEEALRELPATAPDVVLMDINLPGRSGIACVRVLRRLVPDAALLMLTIEQGSRKLLESLEAGADGYLVKTTPPARLLEAIAEAHAGGSPISSHMARLLVQRFRADGLSPHPEKNLSEREEQILKMLSTGQRAKEVADQLEISVHTVRAGVRSIYRKLHARSVPEAVAKFMGPREE
jgi:DNA-binding NarL/FixJ family response regulator